MIIRLLNYFDGYKGRRDGRIVHIIWCSCLLLPAISFSIGHTTQVMVGTGSVFLFHHVIIQICHCKSYEFISNSALTQKYFRHSPFRIDWTSLDYIPKMDPIVENKTEEIIEAPKEEAIAPADAPAAEAPADAAASAPASVSAEVPAVEESAEPTTTAVETVEAAEAKDAADAAAEEATSEEAKEEKLFVDGGINISLLKQKTWRMWETVSETVNERIGQCPGSPGN